MRNNAMLSRNTKAWRKITARQYTFCQRFRDAVLSGSASANELSALHTLIEYSEELRRRLRPDENEKLAP